MVIGSTSERVNKGAQGIVDGLGSALRWRDIANNAGTLWRHRTGVIGMLLFVVPVVAGIFAPIVAPADPNIISLSERFLLPMWSEGGTLAHPLGTDHLGRDTLSRLVFGARISILVGVSSVAIAGAIGVTLGLIAGYLRGKVDGVIMRFVDIELAIPYIALAMVVVTVLGPGLRNVIITLGILGWVPYARVVRGQVLSIRERDYVLAAKATGAGHFRILVRHILPNVIPHIVIIATFTMATMITIEAALSFLGLGVQPPTSTWGRMLSDARQWINVDMWQPTFPGVAIMVTLLGINLFGDWLRDVWDPRLRGVK